MRRTSCTVIAVFDTDEAATRTEPWMSVHRR